MLLDIAHNLSYEATSLLPSRKDYHQLTQFLGLFLDSVIHNFLNHTALQLLTKDTILGKQIHETVAPNTLTSG